MYFMFGLAARVLRQHPGRVVLVLLARRLLPADPALGRLCWDILGAALLGGASLCVLFAAVRYDALRD